MNYQSAVHTKHVMNNERSHQEEEMPLLLSVDELMSQSEINLSAQPDNWSDNKGWDSTHYRDSKSNGFQYTMVVGVSVGSVFGLFATILSLVIVRKGDACSVSSLR